jgi:hypothetical protein
MLLKCSVDSPDSQDNERVGKSQRTGGACAQRATPSPPSDLTPVCRDERATPSPQLEETPVFARPAAPRAVRVRPEPASSAPEETSCLEELPAAAAATPQTPATPAAEQARTDAEVTADEGMGGATGTDAVSEEDELTQLAVTLSNGAGQQATNVDTAAETDDEAASLALAMQLMQQEQALAQIYGQQDAGGYGFGVADESQAGGEDWIPAEEIEEVEVAEDALDESEATYEQLLELDEQKVIVGLSERAKAGATKIVTLTEDDVASFETLHDKRCCICLCDYEPGEELRQLPCTHGCHMDCMDQHLAQAKTCPMCRNEVVTPRASPESEGAAAAGAQ